MKDVLAEWHASHDCDPGPCVCKCGCTQQMGCRQMGGLCSVCHLNAVWGEDEHGFREAVPSEGLSTKSETE